MKEEPHRDPPKQDEDVSTCTVVLYKFNSVARLDYVWTSSQTSAFSARLTSTSNDPYEAGLRAVRSDSGFCLPELLVCGSQLRLSFIVAAQQSEPTKTLLRADLTSTKTELVDLSDPQPRRCSTGRWAGSIRAA